MLLQETGSKDMRQVAMGASGRVANWEGDLEDRAANLLGRAAGLEVGSGYGRLFRAVCRQGRQFGEEVVNLEGCAAGLEEVDANWATRSSVPAAALLAFHQCGKVAGCTYVGTCSCVCVVLWVVGRFLGEL